MLARTALAAGRVRDADTELAVSPAADSPRNILLAALHAAYDFLPIDSARTLRALDRMRSWSPDRGSVDDQSSDLFARMTPELRLHRIGLLSVRLGRLDDAREAADSIDRMGPLAEEAARGLARMLSSSVRAHVAFAEGRPTESLQWLDRANWPLGADLFESEAYDRWLRAEALEASGRREEALAWYGTMGERSAMEVAYLAPAAYRIGELNAALGHMSEAQRHYRRVTALWSGADAELREYVDRASSRLAGVP
jgi:tetratricopeptide (TPR) repeat protein